MIPWGAYFVMMIYYLIRRPHNRISLNLIESITEIIFFIIHSIFMIFALGFLEKAENSNINSTKETLGVILISIILFAFFLQLFLVLKEQYIVFKETL